MKRISTIISIILLLALIVSCGEDRTYEYEKKTEHNIWMFEQMSNKYLWADNFKEQTFKDYFAFPQKYFSTLIAKGNKDNGSYIEIDTLNVDNHSRGYFNHIDSYGFDFVLIKDPTGATTKSYARVITVYPDSPAEKAGLMRNDFIEMVDAYKLSVNNVSLLEKGQSRTYYVKKIIEDEETGLLSWTETEELVIGASTYVEDVPYHVFGMYYSQDLRIGYLMCSRLTECAIEKGVQTSDYVNEMDRCFANLKKLSVNRLILDLRLCNFGTMEMARRMASYIVPYSSLDKTFAMTFWNDKNKDNNEIIRFDSNLADKTLGLDEVVVITSEYTQGAAEWLINALKYVLGEEKVIVVGKTTAGQEFMTMHIADYKNMLHLYPAVAYVGNGNGDYESYVNGIMPDVEFDEKSKPSLYPYGDMKEVLLNLALENIKK